MTLLERLREAGTTGLDRSPGDPLCAEAAAEIERLRDETDPIDDLMNHLEALLVDPDRDTLTLRADESGGLRLSWRAEAGPAFGNVMTLDRIEANPRLMLLETLRIMRQAVGR